MPTWLSNLSRSGTAYAALAAALGIFLAACEPSGKGGGLLSAKGDVLVNVEAKKTARIQEVHITFCHVVCELVDSILFQKA